MLIYIILTRAGVKNAKRISNPPTRSFSIVATRLSQCNIINSRGATQGDKCCSFFIVAFSFAYLYILYLFYLLSYSFHLLFIINLLLLLIILGFWGVLGFWILGLFGGGIDMCWNFNGCGDFCGGDFWGGGGLVGWVENGSKGLVLVGLVVVGRG